MVLGRLIGRAALDDMTADLGLSVGDVIATQAETRLCGSIMTSYPPRCSLPGSVVLQGADMDGLPDTETASGITWTRSSVVVVGVWNGSGSVALERVVPIVIGEVAALAGSIDSRQGRGVLCTAPDGCDVTWVPLIGFSGPSTGGRSVIVVGTWADEGFAVDDVVRDEG